MERLREAIRKARANRRAHPVDTTRSSPILSPDGSTVESGPPGVDIAAMITNRAQVLDNNILREQRVIAASDLDHRVEPYRQLRTQILKTMRDHNWATLAITSANERAGKTLTAANLAISLSRNVNTTVLLVDLDLRTPTVHEKLNLRPDKGLVDFLEGDAALDEILFDPGLPRLVVLAGRPAGKFSSELLASTQMTSLMSELCQPDATNITIFDLPPLLRNDDALFFTSHVDATLLVVEDGVTTEEQLLQSMELLKSANVIGTILNKARH